MTLSQRNRYFKAGIALSSACILGILTHAARLLPLYPQLSAAAVKRASGLFQQLAGHFFPALPQAPFIAAFTAAGYTLAASLLLYVFFEKTHSPEILFFGLFSLSFVFEVLRFMAPLRELYGFPGIFLTTGARLLIFGRFLGALSLFAAGIYAAGFEQQKQGTIVSAITITTLVISLGIPVDSFAWDTNFVMICGYSRVFSMAETGILVIATLSFFVAAHTRGSREYLAAGFAVFLASLGRNLFINADTLALLFPGLAMLCAGTWIAALKLHKVYLWL